VPPPPSPSHAVSLPTAPAPSSSTTKLLSLKPYTIQIGHDDGSKCKAPSEPFKITLVEFGGIHGTIIRYCTCQGFRWRDRKAEQLVQAGFIPATWANLKTVFSVMLLKHFHNHLETVYNFTEGLRKDTDAAFPSEVPVRFGSLMLGILV
jgi:hypothetical protein